jgi:hypothetical protein
VLGLIDERTPDRLDRGIHHHAPCCE